MRKLTLARLFFFVAASFAAIFSCSGLAQQPRVAQLNKLLHELRWVAYSPTNYNPEVSPPSIPSRDSIRQDLEVLKAAGCTGLVTYGAMMPEIVGIADSLGFRALLLGVWDPSNNEEIHLAERSSSSNVVAGIIVGNEGLMFKRYSLDTLKHAMDSLRRTTGKPISTTEVIESFYTTPEILQWSDFVTLNAHPYFHGQRDPAKAVAWTLASWNRLMESMPRDKRAIFKEVGFPTTNEAGVGESGQETYYRELQRTPADFVFFEAFDQTFKKGAVEQSWGLFRSDRSPKLGASTLAVPQSGHN